MPTPEVVWVGPLTMSPARFESTRQALVCALADGPIDEVYRVGHRAVYRLDAGGLGPVAMKDVRHLRWLQRLKTRYWREAKAVHEFRMHDAFLKAGGRAPELLGMALQRSLMGLARVWIFMRWIDEARTLQKALDEQEGTLSDAQWDLVADLVVDSAHRGLVHGGHSPENILVIGAWRDLCVIDFAESSVRPAFSEDGFLADVDRISRRMAASEAEKRRFAAAVTRRRARGDGPA